VAVRFVTGPSGTVLQAGVASRELRAEPTERCVADAVQRWLFPAPEAGSLVAVTYPFVLQQVGASARGPGRRRQLHPATTSRPDQYP
jgi:hypothetical protein